VQEFTKEDFLQTMVPYEQVYNHTGLKRKQELEIMAEVAMNVGVRNFKSLFNEYCNLIKSAKKSEIIGNYIDIDYNNIQNQFDSDTWFCDERGITGVDRYGFEIVACPHPILPILKLKNIDTGITKVKLIYKTYDRWESIIVEKKVLSSATAIIELSNSNVSVSSENAKNLVKYLQDIEHLNREKIEVKNSVSRLGWIDGEGFSPYVKNLIFDGDINFKTFFESVQEKGSYDKWLELTKAIRQNGIVARIILASSFASVLLHKV
jgi:hypothetical protein